MKKVSLFLALALVLMASGVAFAETVEGTVSSVDLAGKVVKVNKTDAATGAAQEVSVSVNDSTTYTGEVTALAEVIEGDTVKIEADKDATSGNWVAKSVEVAATETA